MPTKFYRRSENKILGGVCAGLADYFDVDVIILRITFITFTLFWGLSIIVYLLLWIFTPIAPFSFNRMNTEFNFTQTEKTQFKENTNNRSRELFGIIVIALGVLWILNNFFPWFSSKIYFPLTLITIGILILVYARNGKKKVNLSKVFWGFFFVFSGILLLLDLIPGYSYPYWLNLKLLPLTLVLLGLLLLKPKEHIRVILVVLLSFLISSLLISVMSNVHLICGRWNLFVK